MTTTVPADRVSHALSSQAHALLRKVALAAQDQDRRDLVEQLGADVQRLAGDTLTVVVCGEGNRGKTSLINALVDRPDLLPVSAERSTARHVSVRRAEPEAGDEAWAQLGVEERRQIPLEDLSRWVVGSDRELVDARVRHVDVTIEHQRLNANLVFIDTPGVGGLDSTHGEAALAALSMADAMLFVVDAAVPVSAVELAFLEQAAQRVDAVLVVLNRIDLTPAWETIRAEDEVLLARSFPGVAQPPIVPLSARMKIRADRLTGAGGDAALAADLAADSGCEELQRVVDAWGTGAAAQLRAANLCRLGTGVLERLTSLERAVLQGSGAGRQDLAQRSQQRRRQHADLGAAARRRRTEVQDRMSVLTREVDTRIASTTAEVRREYQQRIVSKEFDGFETNLAERLGQTAEEVVGWLNGCLAELEADTASAFEGLGVRSDDAVADALARPEIRPTQGTRGKVNLEELLQRAPYVFVAIAMANPYMAVASCAGLLMHHRLLGGRARQEQFRSQMTETLNEFSNDLKLLLHEAVVSARSRLVTGTDDVVQERLTDLVEEIRALDALATKDASDRDARRRLAEQRLHALADLQTRLDGLRGSATSAVRGALGPTMAVAR